MTNSFIEELCSSLKHLNDVELYLINGDTITLSYTLTTIFEWGLCLVLSIRSFERLYIPFESIVYFKVLGKKH